MIRTVTSTELKNSLGELVDWSTNNEGGIVISQYGSPKAVIVGYEEYQELLAARKEQRRREAFAELEKIRARVRARIAEEFPETTDEETYRQAGFSEEVIKETLEHDEDLRRNKR